MLILRCNTFRGSSKYLQKGPQKLIRKQYTTRPYQHLRTVLNQSILHVTLDRPEVHNAFNEDLISEISHVFTNLDLSAIKAVILSGNGNSFSAGADMNWMKKMVHYTEMQNVEDSGLLFDMFYNIKFAPVPVIARVNGAALGGGAGIVAACDMAFAVENATFGFTEVKLGLIPAVISPFVLEKIGPSHASRYFLTGERFNTTEALHIGLINEHHSDLKSLDIALEKILNEIKKNSPNAIKAAKKLIGYVKGLGVKDEETKLYTSKEIAKIRVSEEGQEGLKAFLEKRKPSWVTDMK